SPLEPAQAQRWAQRAVARAETPEFVSAPEARGPLGRPHSSLAARVFSWVGATAIACVMVAASARYIAPGLVSGYAAAPAEAVTYQTLAGQEEIVTLPNGTHVILGPASTIKALASAERTRVDLAGKAL